jgi:hypothetical protein
MMAGSTGHCAGMEIEGAWLTVCGGNAVRAASCTAQQFFHSTTTCSHPAALPLHPQGGELISLKAEGHRKAHVQA